jgi:hypothetical protein
MCWAYTHSTNRKLILGSWQVFYKVLSAHISCIVFIIGTQHTPSKVIQHCVVQFANNVDLKNF